VDGYALDPNVETLVLFGNAVSGSGNNDANRLYANSTLPSTLTGLDGDDVYVFSHSNDQAIEAANGGNDTVYALVNGYALDANVENLVLFGTATSGSGNSDANTLYGNSSTASTLTGLGGDDVYVFNHSNDQAIEAPGGGNDVVYALADGYALDPEVESLVLFGAAISGSGNNEANRLYANSAAASTLTGLGGDDTYIFSHSNDHAIEAANGGNDTVYALVDGYTLDAEVETLVLFGAATSGSGNGAANTLFANATLGSTLTGGGGDDALYARAGNDTFVFAANMGNDTVHSFTAGSGAGDVLQIDHTLYNGDFSDLMANHTAEVGADTVITFDATDSITLAGVLRTSLNADDFAFV
jgi:hypothetical protein